MNDKFLFDLDNGVKYLKCFLYCTLNFVAKIGEFKLISPLNRELFIGLSKSCEEIKVLINESSKELILIFNDNFYSVNFFDDYIKIIKLKTT